MTREERAQELRGLIDHNPQRLIAIYRDAIGLNEIHPLPPGADFQAMIARQYCSARQLQGNFTLARRMLPA